MAFTYTPIKSVSKTLSSGFHFDTRCIHILAGRFFFCCCCCARAKNPGVPLFNKRNVHVASTECKYGPLRSVKATLLLPYAWSLSFVVCVCVVFLLFPNSRVALPLFHCVFPVTAPLRSYCSVSPLLVYPHTTLRITDQLKPQDCFFFLHHLPHQKKKK